LRRCAAPGLPPDTEGEAGEKLQFDECGFVFDVLNAEETPGVMLDVGAHVGGSLLPYARAGWRVHAFEPDPVNREQLLSATAAMENVHVDARAVGAKAAANVPFYRSSVSSGISGLSSFHESHERSGAVSVTTLTDYMSAAGLAGADFLKIDVEGHEMAVLDGFDLAGVRPRAIVAEFEDGKTASHGYVMADLANLFVKAGYAVLVSEWRPIEEYGRTHSWRRLLAYPCEIAPEAWGNLIALREPPEEARLAAAFAGALKGGRAGEGAGALVRRYGAPETPSLYRRGVSFLTAHAPAAARLAGPPMRALRKFLRGSNRRAS
jgi:FkbM family methyltransferase